MWPHYLILSKYSLFFVYSHCPWNLDDNNIVLPQCSKDLSLSILSAFKRFGMFVCLIGSHSYFHEYAVFQGWIIGMFVHNINIPSLTWCKNRYIGFLSPTNYMWNILWNYVIHYKIWGPIASIGYIQRS